MSERAGTRGALPEVGTASRLQRRRDPGRRRIARIRWTTTAVFAAATAACLAILVGAALRIDLASRAQATDTDLQQRVSELADLVTFSGDEQLHLGDVENSLAAQGVPVYGFVTDQSIVYAQPGQNALPSDAVLKTALSDARASHGHAITFVAPEAQGGPPIHWAAATIADLSHYVDHGFTGGIAVAGEPVAQATGHETLKVGLLLAAAGLTLAAAIVGHVVSGLAVRPAIRGLEAQEQFLVEAAHELRTPLATLRVLVERRGPPDTTLAQVDRLSSLADLLLLRARASMGTATVAVERLRLDQLVERCVADGPYADRVRLDLQPTVVSADVDLVERIVTNLVENAFRHGAEPVEVRVSGRAIDVRDSGAGIPARQRRRVLRAGTTSGSGTGTGLAIVAWAARVQHGDLVLGSAPGGGLSVRVVFPSTSSKPHARRGSLDADHTEGDTP
jgi:two-component system, OmpR family, sensor kinase